MTEAYVDQVSGPVLGLAERARTVLAALPCLTWTRDDEQIAVPFVEEVGSPMLLVDSALSTELLSACVGRVELCGHPALGGLRLSGEFWPVAEDASLAVLRDIWADHAGCGPGCAGGATRLVGLRVDRVEMITAGRVEVVDLDAYQLARPDLLVARGLTLADHLNTDHLTDLIDTASALTGSSDLLAARVDWVDARGVELSVIDANGSRGLRFDFPQPVRRPDDLLNAVHHLLQHAGTGLPEG